MTEPICLTAEEVEGLRELLAWMATVEDRGFRDDTNMVRITAQTWRSMTAGPKRKLSRLLRHRAISSGTREEGT